MSIDARLNKVMPGLSARERGILVLRSLKEGTPEDPLWRSTMAPSQTPEFNRLIDLMNLANSKLAHLITFIEGGVDKLTLRFVWLLTLRAWQLNVLEIDYAASLLVREPITESVHRKLVEKGAKEYVPVMKLAEKLAAEERAWSDDDVETLPWSGDFVVKDEAWKGLVKNAAARLIAAADEGDLDSREVRGKIRIRRGSFDAYLGRPATVDPAWAGAWDVRPHADAGRVDGDRRTLAHLKLSLEKPFRAPGDGRKSLDEIIEAALSVLEDGIKDRWCDIRLVETELDRIGAEFGGEDPLKPEPREALAAARNSVQDLYAYLSIQERALELTEPSDAEVEEFRELVEQGRSYFG